LVRVGDGAVLAVGGRGGVVDAAARGGDVGLEIGAAGGGGGGLHDGEFVGGADDGAAGEARRCDC